MSKLHEHFRAKRAEFAAQKRGWLILAAVVVALAIVALVLDPWKSQPRQAPVSQVRQAATVCGVGAFVKDDGSTLAASGITPYAAACVLRSLGADTATIAHLASTRAIDGQQTARWGFAPSTDARWSYHPDAGVTLIVTQ